MNVKGIIFLILFVVLSGCGGTSASLNAAPQNSWIINPPQDTQNYYYGVGEGETLEDATNNALAAISAKISVKISSNFQSSVTAERFNASEDVLYDIKKEVQTKTKDIEFSNIKIENQEQKDGKVYVLVKVSRAEIARKYKKKLEKIDTKIQTQWEFFQTASPFEKIKIANTIEHLLQQTDAIFPLLQTIDPLFDDSQYTKRYTNYTKAIQAAKHNLVMKLEADKNSQALAAYLKEKLADAGVKFSNSHYNVLIKIKTQAKKRVYKSTNEQFKNLVVALRKTTIQAYDKNGNLISNVIYKTKEGSTLGFEDAIEKMTKYKRKIKQLGVIGFISANK